jgi:BMFP domain-containing protein YqiC
LQFGIFAATYPHAAKSGKEPEARRDRKQKFKTIMSLHAPDLTKQPPRSPRVRLGGYVTLPRMLDKGRATVAGKNGEYHYACPLDQRFLEFAGIDPEKLKKELGQSDREVLEWIEKNAKHKRTEVEIAAWSVVAEQRTPTDVESREYFNGLHKQAAPTREDITTWFDLLDVDDYVSFGGKA